MADGFSITVLLSGTGRSLANLIAAIESGHLGVDIAHVVSSRPGVRGLEIATAAGVPTTVVARRDFDSVDGFSAAMTAAVAQHPSDLIVMAGFLSLYRMPPELEGRVINVHPSLLPLFGGKGFYGHRVHRAALDSGMRVSGCTVHFVDNDYDRGPIILQRACPIRPDDDADRLADRVFAEECIALPTAIEWVRSGHVRYDGDGGRAQFRSRAEPELPAIDG